MTLLLILSGVVHVLSGVALVITGACLLRSRYQLLRLSALCNAQNDALVCGTESLRAGVALRQIRQVRQPQVVAVVVGPTAEA